MDADILDLVRSCLGQVRVPAHTDKVYKDECGFSFATPVSRGGLYINLSTFQAYSADWVELDHRRTGQVLYLHEQWTKVPKEKPKEGKPAPTELALGTEGGFSDPATPTYDTITESAVVLVPAGVRVLLPCPELPELILQSVAAIQSHDSAKHEAEVASWTEERRVSRYAQGLEQLPATRRIPTDPAEWRCDETGTAENLWLNLSTGFIGSGRPHWDGTGGNGAALRHFEATGRRYPLAVKLGTITPAGADVYSYAPDEDDMVLDPLLAEHLAHWGINIQHMQKTEATMTELQIQKNLEHEFDRMTEAGADLEPLTGPGYIGLKNLGNSCYMNSTLQTLWALPELAARYLPDPARSFEAAPRDVPGDVLTQWTKVGNALVQGRTPPDEIAGQEHPAPPKAVTPAIFKTLIGRGHPEFSTQRQQARATGNDAEEFLVHLLDALLKAERRAASGQLPGTDAAPAPRDLFEFELEDRIQCTVSGRVSYKRSKALVLGLNIPRELALAAGAGDASKRQRVEERDGEELGQAGAREQGTVKDPTPEIPPEACLDAFFGEQRVEGVYSAAIQDNAPATKQTAVATFPRYLAVQLRRYYVAEDWTSRKLEVAVPMPDALDLERFRGRGLQPGEEPQPEAGGAAGPGPAPIDEGQVSQLMDMGFGPNAARRAVTAAAGVGPEAAMAWLLEHLEDPGINDPLPTSGQAGDAPATDAASLEALTSMGFTPAAARKALAATAGDVERAADWLFSRMDDLAALEENEEEANPGAPSAPPAGASPSDGPGRYELVGFVSHMGANTSCGHYVAHVRKDGRWVLFNDEKVAASHAPPKELGYLYFYRRVGA